jgi:hypothetical protein
MKFIQGHNRKQINLSPVSLDQSIDPENEVRIIDLFVESLPLKDFGFVNDLIGNFVRCVKPSSYCTLLFICVSNILTSKVFMEYLRILVSLFFGQNGILRVKIRSF